MFGAVFTAVYAEYSVGFNIVALSPLAACAFLYMIWGGGVAAMMFWNMGTKFVGASYAAIFLNLLPIVGIISAYFTLGEAITWQKIISAVIIISGVYITTHSAQLMVKFNVQRKTVKK